MPELLHDVSHDDYRADNLPGAPHFSRSVAVTLLQRSPLHAWAAHPKLGGQAEDPADSTPAMEFGSLVHVLLLGGGLNVAVVEEKDWRTNRAKEAREEARASGKLPVLAAKYEKGAQAAGAILKRLDGLGIEVACLREATLLWEDQGVACKARTDLFFRPHEHHSGKIWDLKISEQTPGAFVRSIPYDGLDIQAYAYSSAVGHVFPELAGRVQFEFLVCDPNPPHDVAVIPVAPSLLACGEDRWKRALLKWKECMASGRWPGYGRQEPAEAPEWMLKENLTAAIAAAGEPEWAKGI